MTTTGRLAGNAAWNISGKLFQFVVSLVALAIIARWVGPHAYGVFALSWVVVGLVEIVVGAAPNDTLVQRRSLAPEHCNATFWIGIGVAVLAFIAIVALAAPIADVLGGARELAAILPLRAAVLPLMAGAAVPLALLMRAGRFKRIAAIEAAGGLSGSIVGIVAALAGAGIWSLVAMELARQAMSTALALRAARWTPSLRMTRAHATDLLAFNAATWAAWGLSYADSQWPRVLIGVALGPQALGFFALAQRLEGQLGNVLMIPAYQVAMTSVARAQGDRDAVRRLADSMLRAVAVVANPLYFGILAIAPLLVPAVFGNEWLAAVAAVQILILLGVRGSMSMVQMAVIRGMGRPGWQVASTAVGLAVNVALTVLAVPHGLLAVCAAVVARSFLLWPLSAWFVRRLVGLTPRQQAAAAAGPLFAALSMAACSFALVHWLGASLPAPAALALVIPLGALVYVVALPVFAPSAGRFVHRAILSILRRDRDALRALFEGAR
ncbi:MAG: oligosaccharide flippase family protein [Burkholderiaceae bacterium]|nr:oligosaccharide flippase family protein [Burkholderiaceae bacterium]